jgi:hypothetical protein
LLHHRSDVVRLGPQHARGGWLRFKQHKNRNRHPIEIEIPILPELQRILDASTFRACLRLPPGPEREARGRAMVDYCGRRWRLMAALTDGETD